MNLSRSVLLITLSTIAICFSPAFGNSEQDIEDDMESYMSECNAPVELYDPEAMANTMSDPVRFMQLVKSVNNPATVNSILECATHPEQMKTVLKSLSDPVKYMNMMVIFMNPQTYMNWKNASKNPEFNQSEFEMMNASEMVQSFKSLFKLLMAIEADTTAED